MLLEIIIVVMPIIVQQIVFYVIILKKELLYLMNVNAILDFMILMLMLNNAELVIPLGLKLIINIK